MKKLAAIFIIFAVMFSGVAMMPEAYAGVAYEENALDNMWDWATTLGKDGIEKQRILAENKAERLKRHAEKQAAKKKKQAEKAGKDMKKKFGM